MSSLTWICPDCKKEIEAFAERCPFCGLIFGEVKVSEKEKERLVRLLKNNIVFRRLKS